MCSNDLPRRRRPRTSPVWKPSLPEFSKLVRRSRSIGEILERLNLQNIGNNPVTLKRRLIEDGLESEIARLVEGGRARAADALRRCQKKIPIKKILVRGSSYSRFHLKHRLIAEGLLRTQCAVCGQGPTWNDKPLTLILDHRNGVNNDNRRRNLRLLCPNCNSQTLTFAGRNGRYTPPSASG